MVKEKLFDYVVGNPPYQIGHHGHGPVIYPKFTMLALELAQEGMAFVIPISFLHSTKHRKLKDLIYRHNIKEIVEIDAQEVFNVNVPSAGYIIVDMQDESDTYNLVHLNKSVTICNKQEDTGGHTRENFEFMQKLYVIESTRLQGKHGKQSAFTRKGTTRASNISMQQDDYFRYPVIERLSKNNGPVYRYVCDQPKGDDHKIRVAFPEKSSGSSLGALTIVPPGIQLSYNVYYVCVSSQEEAQSLISYLNSKLVQYILSISHRGMGVTTGFLRKIPAPKMLDHIWSDLELYQYFNLTESEIDLIEQTSR